MRKRNCKNLFDNIMWYTIYMLPIILTFLMVSGAYSSSTLTNWIELLDFNGGETGDILMGMPFMLTLESNLQMLGMGYNNSILIAFVDIFEPIGLLDNNYSPCLIMYLAYFVTVYMCHLMVDFLLFIPRLAHKWLNSFTRSDD